MTDSTPTVAGRAEEWSEDADPREELTLDEANAKTKGIGCGLCKGMLKGIIQFPGLKTLTCSAVSRTQCSGSGCYSTCSALVSFVVRHPGTSAWTACTALQHCSLFGGFRL